MQFSTVFTYDLNKFNLQGKIKFTSKTFASEYVD